MSKTLWDKNFTIITLGTIISAIGGTAMAFAMSFVVFANTGSTLLSALFAVVSYIPGVVLPILVSPYLDNFRRKPVIVGLDYLSCGLFLLFGLYLLRAPFSFPIYMLFDVLTSSISAIYNLTYTSLYPNLIPEGFAQKGYTVSGMIYPTVLMVMTPGASVIYTKVGLAPICLGEGVLLGIAATVETQIRIEERVHKGGRFDLKAYMQDFREGLAYMKQEKGLQRIYSFMPITNGMSEATEPLIRAYFLTAPGLNITMYALFTTAQFIGRTIGGVIHYKFRIPPEKRFSFSLFVHVTYDLMDAALLWLGFPLMMANRAFSGFLGMNSATLRESSVQNYLPDQMRAKVNAAVNAMFSLVPIPLVLAAGALGEVADLRLCVTALHLSCLIPCYLFLWRGREDVKKIYNRTY